MPIWSLVLADLTGGLTLLAPWILVGIFMTCGSSDLDLA